MKRNDNAPPRAVYFRRELIFTESTLAVDLYLARSADATDPTCFDPLTVDRTNGFIVTADGTVTFYAERTRKEALPIFFQHGWPLRFDHWDAQMLFLVSMGYRVVAHDRCGHGHSAQVSEGHDKDHCALDALAVNEALDLKNAAQIGHTTGGPRSGPYVATQVAPVRRVANPIPVRVASAFFWGWDADALRIDR